MTTKAMRTWFGLIRGGTNTGRSRFTLERQEDYVHE